MVPKCILSYSGYGPRLCGESLPRLNMYEGKIDSGLRNADLDFAVAEARYDVIVDHPDRLHECITDR